MTLVRRVVTIAAAAVFVLVLFGGGWLVGRLGIGAVVDPASLTDAERRFVDEMRDVSLVGRSPSPAARTARRRPIATTSPASRKSATICGASTPKMDCCGVNGAIPIVVPMRWIGDTPVIMMTDTSLPGLGTFTVRVFFYGDRYAGTWQHGKVGGHMSGRIERNASQPSSRPARWSRLKPDTANDKSG